MIDWVMDISKAEPIWESMNYTKVNTLGLETAVHVDFRELKRISRIRKEPIRVDETNLSAFFDFLNASSEQVVTGSLETEELNRTINRQYEPEETPSDDDGYQQEINLDDWSI